MAKQSASTNSTTLTRTDLWDEFGYTDTPLIEEEVEVPPVPKQDNYRQKGRSEFAPYFRRIDNYKKRIDFFQEADGKYDHKIQAAACKLSRLLGKKATTNIPAEIQKPEVEELQRVAQRHRKDRRDGRRPLHLPNARR